MDGLTYEFNELRNSYGIIQTQFKDSQRANSDLYKQLEVSQFELKKMAELQVEFEKLKESCWISQTESKSRQLDLDEKTTAIQDYEKRT